MYTCIGTHVSGCTLSFADDILVYRHGRSRQDIAELVQLELNRIDEWCSEMNGKIHPDKASTLWLTLNNHAVNAVMPNVSIGDKAIKREDTLRYLGIIFDRSLSGKDHITRIVQRSRKGLTALKTMAGAKMPQKILVILYQALVVSVMEYGLGLLTLSKSQLQRLDVIQNEGMRAILGCTKDTSAEAMRHLLDLPTVSERHKLAPRSATYRWETRLGGTKKCPIACKMEEKVQLSAVYFYSTQWKSISRSWVHIRIQSNQVYTSRLWTMYITFDWKISRKI